MRQTVRLDEVRAPLAPSDALSPDAVEGIDASAQTLDDHYKGVLSQIKNLLGADTWRESPANSVLGLAQAQQRVSDRIAAQVATLAAHDQALASQAQAINQLSGSITGLLALKADVAALSATLGDLANIFASHAEMQAVCDQVSSLDRNLVAQLTQVQGQLAQALSTLAAQDQRLGSIEAAQGNFVTASGLHNVLANAFVVDAPLVGAKDARNVMFGAPEPFVPSTLQVRYNGQGLLQGSDYVVIEAADTLPSSTIRLLHPEAAPHAQDVLTATYLPATTAL